MEGFVFVVCMLSPLFVRKKIVYLNASHGGAMKVFVRKVKKLMNLTTKENKTTVSEEEIRKPTPFQNVYLRMMMV